MKTDNFVLSAQQPKYIQLTMTRNRENTAHFQTFKELLKLWIDSQNRSVWILSKEEGGEDLKLTSFSYHTFYVLQLNLGLFASRSRSSTRTRPPCWSDRRNAAASSPSSDERAPRAKTDGFKTFFLLLEVLTKHLQVDPQSNVGERGGFRGPLTSQSNVAKSVGSVCYRRRREDVDREARNLSRTEGVFESGASAYSA